MTSVAGLPVCRQYFSSFSASCAAKFTVIRFTAHFLLVILLCYLLYINIIKGIVTKDELDKIIRVFVGEQVMLLTLKDFFQSIVHSPIKYTNHCENSAQLRLSKINSAR